MYASELEVEIVRGALNDIGGGLDTQLLVLACGSSVGDRAALADKWLRELHQAARSCAASRVTVLNNQDNVHYRFTRFNGSVVTDRARMVEALDALMDSDSDSSVSDV